MEERVAELEKTVKYLENELEIVYKEQNKALLQLNENIKKNTIKIATYEVELRNLNRVTNRQSIAQGLNRHKKKTYKKNKKNKKNK